MLRMHAHMRNPGLRTGETAAAFLGLPGLLGRRPGALKRCERRPPARALRARACKEQAGRRQTCRRGPAAAAAGSSPRAAHMQRMGWCQTLAASGTSGRRPALLVRASHFSGGRQRRGTSEGAVRCAKGLGCVGQLAAARCDSSSRTAGSHKPQPLCAQPPRATNQHARPPPLLLPRPRPLIQQARPAAAHPAVARAVAVAVRRAPPCRVESSILNAWHSAAAAQVRRGRGAAVVPAAHARGRGCGRWWRQWRVRYMCVRVCESRGNGNVQQPQTDMPSPAE